MTFTAPTDRTRIYGPNSTSQSSTHRSKRTTRICGIITKRHSFQYDLNAILSTLVYGRVLESCSKRATYAFSKTLLEKPEFEEYQIYRALDVLAEESDFIQSALYNNNFVLGKRHTS